KNPTLKSVEILGKIILPNPNKDSSDFIVNVTINNNRQNPVEPWNLRASDMIQLEFSDKFREELGIYYERQENAFDSLSQEDMEEMKIVQNKSIQIKKLAQTFMVIQGEVDKVSRLRDLFEDEKKYYNTFRKKYLNVDSKKILLIYKIQFRLKSAQNAIMEASSEKYQEFYSKSKNLIWGLIVQGILNDSKLETYIENFGKNLMIEANFNELVKSIGEKKVRPILSDIWRDEKYQKNITEQNYSFLKTRAVFDKAMLIAKDRYSWTKLDI
ncbi:MAG: AIPR family protein, partial [Leptospiraceae bacterium]|nr:AIPR family protein [Leptospiraceae bacterium]